MKQEEKTLLLQDLCARLPYGVRVDYKGEIYDVLGISHGRLILCKPFMSRTLEYCPLVEEVKLCLFPLSSMTEEQSKEFALLQTNTYTSGFLFASDCINMIRWLNENHFDYHDLISKGLAIDCTGLNIY